MPGHADDILCARADGRHPTCDAAREQANAESSAIPDCVRPLVADGLAASPSGAFVNRSRFAVGFGFRFKRILRFPDVNP